MDLLQSVLFFIADCDGSDSALQLSELERLGWSVGYSSAGAGPVPHRHKVGRNAEKYAGKQ